MIAGKNLSAGTVEKSILRKWPLGIATIGALALSGCGESNTYVPPPPPKVTVANPIKQPYTRYLTATGNVAAINTANLVARVSGFLQSMNYKDGTFVKKGTLLFVIEPEPYKLQVDQSKAAKIGAQATYNQQVAELKRQQDLAAKEFASQAKLDSQRASTDNAQANLQSTTAALSNAEINYSYTHVLAPFDGIVSARQVSVGDYVGGSGQATVLVDHRADRADLCEFLDQRAAGPAYPRRHDQARDLRRMRSRRKVSGRSRAADRQRLSVQRQNRLRQSDGRHLDRHAFRARHFPQYQGRPGARLFRSGPGAAGAGSGCGDGAGCGARQRSGRADTC